MLGPEQVLRTHTHTHNVHSLCLLNGYETSTGDWPTRLVSQIGTLFSAVLPRLSAVKEDTSIIKVELGHCQYVAVNMVTRVMGPNTDDPDEFMD